MNGVGIFNSRVDANSRTVYEAFLGSGMMVRLVGATQFQALMVSNILSYSGGETDSLSTFLNRQAEPQEFGDAAFFLIDFGTTLTGAVASHDQLGSFVEGPEASGIDLTVAGQPNLDFLNLEDSDWQVRIRISRELTVIDGSTGISSLHLASSLSNSFYQMYMGLADYDAFVYQALVHELLHAPESQAFTSPSGGTIYFNGHEDLLDVVLSNGVSDETPLALDITRDSVENRAIAVLLGRGIISTADGTKDQYIRWRESTYRDAIDNLAGKKVRTFGDLRDAITAGRFRSGGHRLLIDEDGTIYVEEGPIVIGDFDAGRTIVSAASALGSTLGRRLFGDDRLLGSLSGSVFGQITSQLSAKILNSLGNSSDNVQYLANRNFERFGIDTAGAGAGALTSYLVGEVFAELGIDGFAGEALQSVTSGTLSSIASNIVKLQLGSGGVPWNNFFNDLGGNVLNIAGSFLGSKLASFIKTFDSVGGQIGFSVGGVAGGVAIASIFSASTTIVANFLAPGVGTLVGALLGGAIGSLFGGTPESGAHLQWNNATQEFEIGATWADDWGGSSANDAAEDRAVSAATTAGDVLNRLYGSLGYTQGFYENPDSPTIAQGAYGQRGDDWLYWGNGENSRTHPLSGTYDNPLDAINHGLEIALGTMTIRGGDRYLKRALYKSIENAAASGEFDFSQIIGDMAIGADLSFYEDNHALIDAAIALSPESALAQGWVLTLLRGAELDIDQYYKSDFYGGLGGFLDDDTLSGDPYVTPGDVEIAWGPNGDLRIMHERAELPGGHPDMPGANDTRFAQARWAAVAGPGGETVTAMDTGQLDGSIEGGGLNRSAPITIDDSKAYEFTVYVRKHDLSAHRIYFGAAGGTIVDAVTGAAAGSAFTYPDASWQQAHMDEDRWYKIVGVILPEGETASSHADDGGIYDMVTGAKIADTTTFAWDPNRTSNETFLRFLNQFDEDVQGYSTYWYAPSVRILDAEGNPGPNMLSTEGWPGDPYEVAVIPDFKAKMGYVGGTVTSSYTGNAGSNIAIASGAAALTLQDISSAPTAEGPGITGQSQLRDDIFIGNDGNNILRGYYGWDWLDGQKGHDSLYGGDGNDVLLGRNGNDSLLGQNDDDRLDGGNGNDKIYGQDGDDLVYYGDGADIYDGGAGIDTFSLEGLKAPLGGGNGYENHLYLYNSSYQRSYLADDTLTGFENAIGSRFDDRIIGTGGGNVLDGRDGNDLLNGGSGNDTLIGGGGADELDGDVGLDTASYRTSQTGVDVSLESGGHALYGDAEGDVLISIENLEGSEFADVLAGRTGASTLSGLGGNDLFMATSGATSFYGGEGVDTADYSDSNAAVTVSLSGTAGSGGYAQGDKHFGIEWLVGSDYGDSLTGTDAAERFQGGTGSDYIYSNGGDDSFVMHRGGGIDHVSDASGAKDYVVVDKAISLDSLQLRKEGSSLYLRSGADRVYINSHFNDVYAEENFLEYVTFANGSSINLLGISVYKYGWSVDNNASNSPIDGGDLTRDFSHGGSGDDIIHTYGFDDVLIGGNGTDHLYGGSGNDQYVFGRSSSVDIIHEGGGSDTLIIADDISADELMFEYAGNDLYIGIKDPNSPNATALTAQDHVVITGQKLAGGAIEKLQIGLQNISLPAYMGDLTGSDTAPDVPSPSFTKHAPFSGGTVGFVQAYDADGDNLTYQVTGVRQGDGLIGSSSDFYFIDGGAELYTTMSWNTQDFRNSQIEISVSDGQNVSSGLVSIRWRPDPQGGTMLPIVLDLDGDGIELVDAAQSNIEWDVDQDGYLDQLGWVGADDAFLAFDRDGSGTVNSLSELTFVGDLEGAQTDLEGLAAFDQDYDSIADGILDANDVWFHEFFIWQDVNQNGVSEQSEMVRLADSGVVSINLSGTPTGQTINQGNDNVVLNLGSYTNHASQQGAFGDVGLGVIFGAPAAASMTALIGAGGTGASHARRSDIDALLTGKIVGGDSGALPGVASGTGGGRLTPIVLDLDRNGLELVSIGRSPVLFDADADGRKEWIGWFAPGDAVLAMDIDGDGAITNGLEISFTRYVDGARTDLEGLAGLDSDANGRIDAGDARFGDLLVWQDRNMDGLSQAEELEGLAAAEVSSIVLGGNEVASMDGGNVLHRTTVFEREDGRGGIVGDAELGYIELTDNELAELAGDAPLGAMHGGRPIGPGKFSELYIDKMLSGAGIRFGKWPEGRLANMSGEAREFESMRQQLVESLALAPETPLGMAQLSREQRHYARADSAMVTRCYDT